MSMTMSRSNPHPTFHSCLQNDIMMVLSIVSTIIYGILFARFCIVEHGTTISSFLCHIVTLAPPIETGLSFSTGTFLSNYDALQSDRFDYMKTSKKNARYYSREYFYQEQFLQKINLHPTMSLSLMSMMKNESEFQSVGKAILECEGLIAGC